jgi:hypothetical protein
LVSTAFFRLEGFAADFDGRYAVVTGYAWQPYWNKRQVGCNDYDSRVKTLKVLLNVLDSDVFYLLAREYSSLVSGGQVDLAPGQIYAIPFPAFHRRLQENPCIQAEFNRMSTATKVRPGEYATIEDRNALAAEYFGIPIADWPLPKVAGSTAETGGLKEDK